MDPADSKTLNTLWAIHQDPGFDRGSDPDNGLGDVEFEEGQRDPAGRVHQCRAELGRDAGGVTRPCEHVEHVLGVGAGVGSGGIVGASDGERYETTTVSDAVSPEVPTAVKV